jgi:hypothetical protein
MMSEVREFPNQPLLVPEGISLRPEEISAHVVVNPVNVPAHAVEVLDHLGANQPVAARYEDHLHRKQ